MEADFAKEMSKLGLRAEDVEERFQRSSGPGGQNVNKVSTSVTLVHRPSGISVTVQDHRSQMMNREVARTRLVATIRERRAAARAELKQAREKAKRASRPKPRGLKERILKAKKQRSEVKKMRGRVD